MKAKFAYSLNCIPSGLKKFFTFLIIAATPQLAIANVSLYEIHTKEALLPLILPVRNQESVQDALKAHLNTLSKNPDLAELFSGRTPVLTVEKSIKLELNTAREHRTLLIANLPKDYTKDTQRVQNFAKIFKQAKQISYILPVAANLHLNANDKAAFHQALVEHFPMMVAMGGDDVATDLYKQTDFHARNTLRARDEAELSLIKDYTRAGKGFLLGVCRGSQLSAVALGYKLIQDVPFQIGEKVQHSDHWHDIKLLPTTHKILKNTPNNQGADKLFVNSLHHQAVSFKPGGPLELAAVGADGVTEATEFKNGKGLLLQFHPELMGNELGSKILFQTVKQKTRIAAPLCNGIFR